MKKSVGAGFSIANPRVKQFLKIHIWISIAIIITGFMLVNMFTPTIYIGLAGIGILATSLLIIKKQIDNDIIELETTRKIIQLLVEADNVKQQVNDLKTTMIQRLNTIMKKHQEFSDLINNYCRFQSSGKSIIQAQIIMDYHDKIQDSLNTAKYNRSTLMKEKEELTETVKTEPKVREAIKNHSTKLQEMKGEIDACITRYPTRYNHNFKTKNKDMNEIKIALNLCKDMLKNERDKLNLIQKEINELQQSIDKIPEIASKIPIEIADVKNTIIIIKNNATRIVQQLKEDIRTSQTKIKNLFNELPERYKNLIDELQIDTIQVFINKARTKLESEEQRTKTLKREIESLKYVRLHIPKIEKEIESLMQSIEQSWINIENEVFKISEKNKYFFNNVVKNIQDYQERLKLFKKELDKVENTINDLRVDYQTTQNQHNDEKIEINKCFNRLLKMQKDKIPDKFLHAKEKCINLKYKKDVLEKAKDILEAVNVKIIEETIPTVERYMSNYISDITNGRYWKLYIEKPTSRTRKAMEFHVYDSESGEKVKINRMSGGTEDQVMLALRLAFGMALLPKADTAAPRFLILDECFASSDIERRENIVNLIKNKMNQHYQQILVITHEEDVIQNIPHYIEMENGKIVDKNIP
ncbi:MAG: ATP-binding protein [Promethearchaeota archaeon]